MDIQTLLTQLKSVFPGIPMDQGNNIFPCPSDTINIYDPVKYQANGRYDLVLNVHHNVNPDGKQFFISPCNLNGFMGTSYLKLSANFWSRVHLILLDTLKSHARAGATLKATVDAENINKAKFKDTLEKYSRYLVAKGRKVFVNYGGSSYEVVPESWSVVLRGYNYGSPDLKVPVELFCEMLQQIEMLELLEDTNG